MSNIKKSSAQIRRSQRRAESRGEVYVVPISEPTEEGDKATTVEKATSENNESKKKKIPAKSIEGEEKKRRLKAAIQLTKELALLEKNVDAKAKDRRASKRKAEAIAAEAAGCSATELLVWYDLNKAKTKYVEKKIPYIAFIGQISYETTADDLFYHIQKDLGTDKDFKTTISRESVKIRLLTDVKTKKSRGMAFVEVDDPETLYALLKLHHTHLKGRRINVERTVGGGVETRKAKITSLRQEQQTYMKEAVQSMLKEYQDRGEIKKEGELDEGVFLLCTRHSASVVQAALERYVESNGSSMDNPSAYLTFLLGKLASEGIYRDREEESSKKNDKGTSSKRQRTVDNNEKSKVSAPKRDRNADNETNTKTNKRLKESSTFAQAGVEMGSFQSSERDLLKIFPSMNRGRGRGRGYM